MKAFTLLELLIVIGIIVVLMGIAIVAINPAKQIAQANNASRWSGVEAISSAISQRIIDNEGRLNYDVPGFATTDCPYVGDDVPTTSAAIMGSAAGQYNLCAALVTEYLAALPIDPQTGSYTNCTSYNTGYNIVCTPGAAPGFTGRITICAPSAQLGQTICVNR